MDDNGGSDQLKQMESLQQDRESLEARTAELKEQVLTELKRLKLSKSELEQQVKDAKAKLSEVEDQLETLEAHAKKAGYIPYRRLKPKVNRDGTVSAVKAEP